MYSWGCSVLYEVDKQANVHLHVPQGQAEDVSPQPESSWLLPALF